MTPVPAPSPALHCSTYTTRNLFNKTCISVTFTTRVFPEMRNPKHLWCSREMYMKLNVLILCKPQVTSDLYSGKKGICGGARGEGGPCCRAAYFIFSPRGLEELLHSGVLAEVTRLLYKQFTWRPSSTQRECLMQCSQFLKCFNAQDADMCPILTMLHYLSVFLFSFFFFSFRLFCRGKWKPRLINLVSCLG